MERRKFIKCSGTLCGGLAVMSFLGASLLESCATPLQIVKTTQKDNKVAIPLNSFDINAFKLLRVKDYAFDIAVQKLQNNSFRVLLMMCPHANQPITKSGNQYICPTHGSRFDEEGTVTKGPSPRSLTQLKYEISSEQLIIHL